LRGGRRAGPGKLQATSHKSQTSPNSQAPMPAGSARYPRFGFCLLAFDICPRSFTEPALSGLRRCFAEFTLSGQRRCFAALSMTESEGLSMTAGEGFRMTIYLPAPLSWLSCLRGLLSVRRCSPIDNRISSIANCGIGSCAESSTGFSPESSPEPSLQCVLICSLVCTFTCSPTSSAHRSRHRSSDCSSFCPSSLSPHPLALFSSGFSP
jgi:hypothetical protein